MKAIIFFGILTIALALILSGLIVIPIVTAVEWVARRTSRRRVLRRLK